MANIEVTILNHSAKDSVKIEVQGRNDKGRFTAERELVIPPKGFVQEKIHAAQKLQVIAVEKK